MDGSTILVTGGSGGIGRSVVEALLRDGATVALTYSRNEGAARELESTKPESCRAYRLDLADRREPDSLIERIERDLSPLTGLVNGAGIRRESLLAMTSDQDWESVLEINLGGVFRCCRAVLPGMIRRRRGSVVNVASLSAIQGLPGQAAYAASKAGVVGLTRSLAREVGKRGIRVNAVLPGFVSTELTADLPPERVELLRSLECLPDGVEAASIAETVVFLLSERARSITGQTLVVDAGASA